MKKRVQGLVAALFGLFLFVFAGGSAKTSAEGRGTVRRDVVKSDLIDTATGLTAAAMARRVELSARLHHTFTDLGFFRRERDNKRGNHTAVIKKLESEAYPLSDQLAEQDLLLPRCTSVDQYASGSLRALLRRNGARFLHWMPDTCFVPPLETVPGKKVTECMKNTTVMFLGDSLLASLVISYVQFSPPLVRDEVFGSPKTANTISVYTLRNEPTNKPPIISLWFQAIKQQGALRENTSIALIKTTDYAVIGGGMHDMGVSFHTDPQDYFHGFLEALEFLKKHMKSGATLVVFILHQLHTETRCPKELACRRCNNPVKEQAMREAQILAASCAGAEIFDTTSFTQHLANFTRDGVHLDGSIRLEADLLIEHICTNLPFSNTRRMPCTPEVIDKMKAKWIAAPDSQVGCRTIEGQVDSKVEAERRREQNSMRAS
ncbi:hypothetical protein DIPPA_04179 [Diplonema papillatum]|nr:hypothetical protein DIPPA_04179 [Diplonema papillatum]